MTTKLRPGRPPGHPKTGGRVKGTPNRDTAQSRERIAKDADPIGFLCKVVRGDRMTGAPELGANKKTWWYPTPEQRINAANSLARKVLSDLKSVEKTGDALMDDLARMVQELDERRTPISDAEETDQPEETDRSNGGTESAAIRALFAGGQ
jgi:hypothetical protein